MFATLGDRDTASTAKLQAAIRMMGAVLVTGFFVFSAGLAYDYMQFGGYLLPRAEFMPPFHHGMLKVLFYLWRKIEDHWGFVALFFALGMAAPHTTRWPKLHEALAKTSEALRQTPGWIRISLIFVAYLAVIHHFGARGWEVGEGALADESAEWVVMLSDGTEVKGNYLARSDDAYALGLPGNQVVILQKDSIKQIVTIHYSQRGR